MSDDFDPLADLLGSTKPEPAPVSPRRARMQRRAASPPAADNFDPMTLEHAMKGWSATQFSKVLGMDLSEVKRRLADVVPMSGAKNSAKYNIKIAMPHLVNPIMDVEEYIQNMDPKDMPTQMTEAFWRGEEKRLKTMTLASQLWPTATVIEGYASIFKIIRDQINLWLDTVDESEQMTDKQRKTLAQLIASLNKLIVEDLEEFAEKHTTRSQLQFLQERLDAIESD